ncbi:MAG: universal stress protein [Bacteroidetes bacterium]|nr:universal stress protein [Bacteroidota bacterium]
MEKILLAIDSRQMEEGTTTFACHLARLTQSRLTAVFLEQPQEETTLVFGSAKGNGASFIIGRDEGVSSLVRQENISRFQRIASEENVDSSIYLDKGVPAEEIISESRFADLLVVNGATSFSDDASAPTEFIRAVLQEPVCPVVIAPASFEGFGNVIFCYDGSKSSLFAMKQFTYLFPQLRAQRAKVIFIGEVLPPREQAHITDWVKYHYTDVEWIIEEEESTEALFNYLLKKKNDFVVMGSYGKGLLASFFAPSEAGELRTTSLPIFIAHY